MLNALPGNGDAHVKNWSLIYDDPKRPRLSAVYDLVATVAYMTHDTSTALNMAGAKRFDAIGLDTCAALFSRIGLKDQVREDLLEEVRATARRVGAVWQPHFAATGVPDRLTRRVAVHRKASPLSWL